jgi:hypothetical protein
MSILDELAKLTPTDRNSRLGQLGVRDAIIALGTENGVAWLEKHIESPVSTDWGGLLFALKAPWSHLERWLSLSRFHCLAVLDALRCYAEELEMPEGANAESIHAALDRVQAVYGSPRIKMAVKEIRHTWPLGGQKHELVDVPPAFKRAAEILFRSNATAMKGWQRSMSEDPAPPDQPEEIWISLIEFGQSQELLAIVDWRERLAEVVEQLKSLQSARSLNLAWDSFAVLRLELERGLKTIGGASISQGLALVSLDHEADDYVLTFLPSDEVPNLVAALEPFGFRIAIFK